MTEQTVDPQELEDDDPETPVEAVDSDPYPMQPDDLVEDDA